MISKYVILNVNVLSKWIVWVRTEYKPHGQMTINITLMYGYIDVHWLPIARTSHCTTNTYGQFYLMMTDKLK